MDAIPFIALGTAVAGLGLATWFFTTVRAASTGGEKMVGLMEQIQSGARAFLKQEYSWVAAFVFVMAVLIAALLDYGRPWGAISYVSGAVLSALAGYVGMTVATMANVRTAEAAKTGPQKALPLAFRGGAVMGFSVAGLSLLGLTVAYILFVEVLEVDDAFQVVTAFGLGASSIALFSRVGGGIYTKAADVGADLVGKVEAGIPEDDPRNPATIADNVGDNVGDVAGMGADLFESYTGAIIAPIAFIAFTALLGTEATTTAAISDAEGPFLLFPLAIAGAGMLASIIGAFSVRSTDSASVRDLSRALHTGTNVAMALTLVATFATSYWLFGDRSDNWWAPAVSVVAGLIAGWAIGKVAEVWTSDHYQPVKLIARQSETGPATTILSGISAGMTSVAASVILVVLAVGVAFWSGDQFIEGYGIYGIAMSAIGMLATTGVVVSVDAYGPIADNAGGIAEMAELGPEVREVTDALDSLGNTTAAIAKGFAVGSAALTALALFKSFQVALAAEGFTGFILDLGKVEVFIGVFLGAMLPFLFAALTIDAVGRAANKMIEEVRRQFREIPGLRDGRPGVTPDSARCVAISTRASLREMVVPGMLAIVVPLAIGFVDVNALGGFLAGALVTGFCLAIFMANSGGAWDNAKKYIEAGAHGGKGSDPHKAAVVGDTVGDPFKDTAGPSMNILIKAMTIVALVFSAAFV
ncbi:MAG: putative K(+)-stimulated pyrophosphate-energized sodium pump [Acidimicrobiales bacterium]|nr:MAG: sodium-translocating pyrophosphatase [Actinomycetota bacterium]MBV6508240.1 putative K(+)-stimulated pyrophosphate-energized sodium pump [Acidimicrobiales bacterium]RIK07312.1 MAG: sodium-translocating pyrophosphatase [Acidobacteriota bacterium]